LQISLPAIPLQAGYDEVIVPIESIGLICEFSGALGELAHYGIEIGSPEKVESLPIV
jgi:hypothetical protein